MLRRFPLALRLLKIKDEDHTACYKEILQALSFSLSNISSVRSPLLAKKKALDLHSSLVRVASMRGLDAWPRCVSPRTEMFFM